MPSPADPLAPTPHHLDAVLLRRVLPVLLLLVLALGFGLVSGLFLLPLFPQLHPAFSRLFMFGGAFPRWDLGVPVAFASLVLTPLAIAFAARRLPLRTSRGRIYLGLTVATVLVLDLVLCALIPSVHDGFAGFLSPSFWQTYGPLAALLALTLFLAWLIARRLPLRTLRGSVHFVLTVAFLLIADLVVAAFCPPLLEGLVQAPALFLPSDRTDLTTLSGLAPIAALFALPALALLLTSWWLRLHSWRWLGGATLVLAPVFVYLATDDAIIRRPVTMEEIAPPFPGAEESFAVLMRYGKTHPLGQAFRAPDRFYQNLAPGESVDPAKPDEWLAWLKTHRAAIEADWADLAPVRAWWNELNAFDRIGDLTPSRYDAEIMTFAPPRSLSQHACAIAGLQALDGHGDAAIDTILPVIQVGRKLQSSGRTLVRLMLSLVIERMGVQTAGWILQHAAVSPAARARLVAALSAGGGGELGARRLITVEYAFTLQALVHLPLGELLSYGNPGWLRHVANIVGPFVYNRRTTFNLYGELVAELQELAARRQSDRLQTRGDEFFAHEGRPRFKNFAGALSLREIAPAYTKIIETYWKVQDTRTALLAQLTGP